MKKTLTCRQKINEFCEDYGDAEILLADGFDEAFLGIGIRFQRPVAVYDMAKCLKILRKDGLSAEEADEWMSFNVLGAYVGDGTPIFVERWFK